MIVKICGIKTLKDALTCANAGADMLGFNFYPSSPRYIEPGACAEIISQLSTSDSRLTTIGIFVNESPERIQEIVKICGLDLAQLAGDEPPDDLDVLGDFAFKTIRPENHLAASFAVKIYRNRLIAPVLLVDTNHKGMYGGTGETGDWSIAQDIAGRVPILLAGGLNPSNIAEAIQNVRPWGVDVASGVEASPGVKDPAKISAFISAAKAAAAKAVQSKENTYA